MVGIYNAEEGAEVKDAEVKDTKVNYFQGKGGEDALVNIQNWYRGALGGELKVDPSTIKLPEFDYKTMTGTTVGWGESYPDIWEEYKELPRNLWSSTILKGTGAWLQGEDDVVTMQTDYFMHGSKKHKEYETNGRPVEEIHGLQPFGENQYGIQIYSGNVIDRRGNVIKIDKLAKTEIDDLVQQWESGHLFRKRRGVPNIIYPHHSSPDSPIKIIEPGAPMMLEDTPLGRLITFSPRSAHFLLEPNALGVPTEYGTDVGKLLWGQTAHSVAKWTWDMLPGIPDLSIRLVAGTAQGFSDLAYSQLSMPIFGGLFMNEDNYAFDKKGRLQYTYNPHGSILEHHQFFTDIKDKLHLPEYDRTWPTNPVADVLNNIADKLAPLYSNNWMSWWLSNPATVEDSLLGKHLLKDKVSIGRVLSMHDAPFLTRAPHEMLGAWAGWRFVDRVLGRVLGTGLPKGRKLLEEITGDAKKLFADDIAYKKVHKMGKNWEKLEPGTQDVFIRRATLNYLRKPENFNKWYKSRTFTANRIAAATNEKAYNMMGTGISNSMALGGLGSQELFDTENPWAFLGGALISGIIFPMTTMSRPWSKYIKGSTIRDPSFKMAYKVPLDFSASLLQGWRASVDTLHTMFKKTGQGFNPIPLDQEILNIAALIPDIEYVNNSGKTKIVSQGQKEDFALYLINVKNAAIEAGDVKQLILSIERGKQFMNDLDSMPAEFLKQYNLSLIGVRGLISSKIIDSTVDNLVDLGPMVNIDNIERGAISLRQSRDTAVQLMVMLEDMFKALPESEAGERIALHLNKIREQVNSHMKYVDMRTEDLTNLTGLYKELLTTEDFHGTIANISNQMRVTDLDVELAKLRGEPVENINKIITESRKRINASTLNIIAEMVNRTDRFTTVEAGKVFSDLVKIRDKNIKHRGNAIYQELDDALSGEHVNLSAINQVLKEKFYNVDIAENSIRPSHAVQIKEIVGDTVRIQLEKAIELEARRDAVARFGMPTHLGGGYSQAQLREIINENRQVIAEEIGLTKGFTNNNDYAKFYNILTSDTKQSDELIKTLTQTAHPMATGEFIIPATRLYDIHKLLVAGRRSLGENKSPQFVAYRDSINIIKQELSQGNMNIMKMIEDTGEIYANEFHRTLTGTFKQEIKIVGMDSGKGTFRSSEAHHSNIVYSKEPSVWGHHFARLIIEGDWEKVGRMLKDEFGQNVIVRKSEPPIRGSQQLSTEAGAVKMPPIESSQRVIVDPIIRSQLASVIDWALLDILHTEKGLSRFLKENVMLDLNKAPNKQLAMEQWKKIEENIRSFNDMMDMPVNGEYHLINTLNYKGGVMKTITDDMASVKFLSAGQRIYGDSQTFLDQTVRHILKENPKLKTMYKLFTRAINNNVQKAQGKWRLDIKEMARKKAHYENFYRSVVGDNSTPFNFLKSYEFLTAENGRMAKQYLNRARLQGDAHFNETKEFIKFMIEQGFRSRTSIRLANRKGGYLSQTAEPDARIHEAYVIVPLIDVFNSEIERLGPLLWDPEIGIMKNADHVQKIRAIAEDSITLTGKDVGLGSRSWDEGLMPLINVKDIPASATTGMHLSNALAFAKHKVSPTFLIGTAVARELRMRKIGFYQALIKDPDMVDIFHTMLIEGTVKKGSPAISPLTRRPSHLEGMLIQRSPNVIAKLWTENYAAVILEEDKDDLLVGPVDFNARIDDPNNLEGTKVNIKKEMDEIFKLDKIETPEFNLE